MRCYSHLWNFAWTCQHRILDTDFSTLWYHASIPGKTMCCRFPWWRIKPSSCVYEPVCFLSNFGHRTIHGVRSWIVRIDQDLEGIIRVWKIKDVRRIFERKSGTDDQSCFVPNIATRRIQFLETYRMDQMDKAIWAVSFCVWIKQFIVVRLSPKGKHRFPSVHRS